MRILPWLTAAVLAATACSDGTPTLPPPPSPSAADTLLYAVLLPVPIAWQDAAHAAEFRRALRDVHAGVPQAGLVALFLAEGQGSPADWKALLDVAQQEGFRVVVGFALTEGGVATEGYRPVRTGSAWELGTMGRFLACGACAGHPALYAVMYLDEPWHPTKRPIYTTAELQDLYSTLKSRAAPGTDPKLMLQFSRQIWRQKDNPQAQYVPGMADVVQISALEFQDGQYLSDLLDQNHEWSRRIVHERTPGVPLWTSAQVMGGRLGPAAGYWFPNAEDLRRLLEDVTAPRYQEIHPLTGIAFQKWDSESVEGRSRQFTLGDAYLAGQPAEQAQASAAALRAIQDWIGSRRR